MSRKLHVGNLPFSTTEEDISIRFARFGTVESAEVVTDHRTGQSRCSGLIEMATEAEATAAINGLNFTQFGDLTISVSVASA